MTLHAPLPPVPAPKMGHPERVRGACSCGWLSKSGGTVKDAMHAAKSHVMDATMNEIQRKTEEAQA